jgi:pimeloyl-ACP methyl ester carboxylesterase
VGVDEHTTELAGSPLFYRSAPSSASGPTALYLHGVPTSSDDWIPFLERSGGIAPDLPGFGRSGKGGHLDYSIRGLTDSVGALLDELGVEDFNLVGHDIGAALAVELASRTPQRVKRLVLCNPLPLLSQFRWPRVASLWRRAGVGELVMGSTNRWLLARELRRGSVDPTAWTQERINAIWEHFDQGTQRAILRFVRSLREDEQPTSTDLPTLIVWGERDPWYPAELAGAYASFFPHGELERIPDAGHWPWLDRPEVIERTASFLEQAP